MTLPAGVRLRQAVRADAAAVADVFITSRAAADIPPSVHDDDDVRRWVAEHLLPVEDVWVAEDDDGTVVAFVALTPGWVELLFVAPDRFGQQIGSALLSLAQELHPDGLQLWVFETNLAAQRFYERHGFVPVEHTDGSGNEEGEPDVRYRWGPDPSDGAGSG